MTSRIISILLLTLLFSHVKGQQGSYLDIYAVGLNSQIFNAYDAQYKPGLGRDFDHRPSFSIGSTILATFISEKQLGFRIGVKYANYTQNFKSQIAWNESTDISYESKHSMDVISVPLLLHLGVNSNDLNEKVFFTMGFGLMPNYLLGSNFNISPNPDVPVITTYETDFYYKKITFSYILSLELRIKLGKKDKKQLVFGVMYDKGISNIENENNLLASETPNELLFPLGTLKDYDYVMPSSRIGYKTKLEALSLHIGLSFNLSK